MPAEATTRSTSAFPLGGTEPAGRRGPPDQVGVEHGAALAQHLVGDVGVELDGPLLHRAVGEHHHQQGQAGGEPDHLHRADGGRVVRGTDHHGGIGGQLREQAGGPVEHLLHLAVDLVEEGAHLLVLGRAEDARLGQVVDEEAVALVGRDAPGAGVGLHEIPVTLEGHHFRPHGGRGDLHPGGVGHVGRADRLGAADVLGDHRFENGRLAVVQGALVRIGVGGSGVLVVGGHGRPWHSSLPSARPSPPGTPVATPDAPAGGVSRRAAGPR